MSENAAKINPACSILVSAIMPTRGRPQFVAAALECWRAQTWPNRELVIVDDAQAPSFPAGIDEPGIQYHRLPRRLTIGAKRNIACARANGSIICHWDDDDYSAPGRIEDQVMRLLTSGKSITAYSAMVFETHTGERWLYPGRPTYCIGTSLMYLRSYWQSHPFADRKVDEDGMFSRPAQRSGDVACVPAGDMMVARVHPGSTSPHEFGQPPWRRIS